MQMIYKCLPSDNKKLRRLTLDKNIPNLTTLCQNNDLNKDIATRLGSEEISTQRRQKLKEFYIKEIFLTKCIIDYKISYHLNVASTSTQSNEVITELLPFAIELHSAIPQSVYKLLTKWAREMLPRILFVGLAQRRQEIKEKKEEV